MRRIGWCVGIALSCTDPTSDTTTLDDFTADTDSDTDTDTDPPTVSDTDTDTDTDSDTDTTDTETDPIVYEVCATGAPFTDIQSAVDAASDGDVIDICAGTYGPAMIDSVDVELRGAGRDTTTVDGGTFDPAILVDGSVVGLSGLTLTGTPINQWDVAALETRDGAVVTVTNAAIRDMDAGDVPVFAAKNQDSSLWLEEVLLEDNVTDRGVVLQGEGGSVTLVHCVFRRNDVANVLNLAESDATVTNNLVYDNVSGMYGTAVLFQDSAGNYLQFVMNNTFAENDVPYVTMYLDGPTLFWSNIVADNGSVTGMDSVDLGPDYTDVYGHTTNFSPFSLVGEGTIEEPPIFNDPDNADFTLNGLLSPCVDAGHPDAAWNDTDGSRNDMGTFGGPGGDWTPPL